MEQPLRLMHCNKIEFNIGHLHAIRNSIDENPEYQRESAIWSPEKKELFIDSLINGYDIPKIYFHDLRSKKGAKKYAIIDGKQRLDTIYKFMDNQFGLAEGFRISDETEFKNIIPAMKFEEFSKEDQKLFENISLTVILIENATEDDIEDLFFRLNNGEPLNAAESRNALGGNMATLIREVAEHTFFTKKMRLKNKRYSHYEISAKFVHLEMADMNNKEMFSDLKKKYLDSMVKNNKKLPNAQKEGLIHRIRKNLTNLNKLFSDNDPLLAKQAYPPMYYLFGKLINTEYGHKMLNTYLTQFLIQFEVKRQQNLLLLEEERDVTLSEFSRLIQQGTNDITSLKSRVSILRRYFLLDYPDVKLLDKRRQFTAEERYVIYIVSGKQCTNCQKEFSDIKEMEADHFDQHKFGGETSLRNARALCIDCNQSLKEKVK